MRRKTAILLSLGAAAVIAAAWLFLVRNRPLFAQPDATRQVLLEAVEHYDAMEMLPLAQISGAAELQALVRDTQITGPLDAADPRAAALADVVSEFLARRFVQDSAEEYRTWREGQGYAWAERDWLEGVWGIGRDYPTVVGEPYPEGAPLPDIFDAYYKAALDYGGGANRPAAVAASREGRCIATALLTRDNPDRALLTCDLGFDSWHGATNGTARSWWRPPSSITELIQRDGSVLCAEVGLVMEFENKTRRPVVVTATWDPAVSRWTMQYLCMYNFLPEQMSRFSAMDY